MGETLWAPWRMAYIETEKSPGCILCDKPRESRDADNLILWRGQRTFVMMNRYPYNNGHLMIVPQAHAASLTTLDAAQRAELGDVTALCEEVLRQAMQPQGFNIGLNLGAVAGAGIAEHLHVHMVPRWAGDTSYITVVGEVRVIPQHLEHTYQTLLPYFQQARHGATSS